MSNDGHRFPELVAFYLEKRMNKIEYEEIGTCARIEISQDADNADQKVKPFLKIHKTYKLLWEAYFQYSSFPRFYAGSHITNFSIPPLENES